MQCHIFQIMMADDTAKDFSLELLAQTMNKKDHWFFFKAEQKYSSLTSSPYFLKLYYPFVFWKPLNVFFFSNSEDPDTIN